LDVDIDGTIDLYDKYVTVPGPVENNGCPLSNNGNGVVSADETVMNGIEFVILTLTELNLIIRRSSTAQLAISILIMVHMS